MFSTSSSSFDLEEEILGRFISLMGNQRAGLPHLHTILKPTPQSVLSAYRPGMLKKLKKRTVLFSGLLLRFLAILEMVL